MASTTMATPNTLRWDDYINTSLQPTAEDPFGIVHPKTIWEESSVKSMLPTTGRRLAVGDLCVTDGLPIPQRVTSIEGKVVSFESGNICSNIDKVYKLYAASFSLVDIQLGDILIHKKGSCGIVTTTIAESGYIKVTSGGGVNLLVDLDAELTIYKYKDVRGSAQKFTCGTVVYENRTYTDYNTLLLTVSDFDADIIDIGVPHSYAEIATEYDIPLSSVIPKDKHIDETLKLALDHPLNVEAKEWALLVSGSGSGKSVAAVKYAESLSKEYIKIQCTAQLTVDDLLGYKSITDGTYFPSLLRDAVENGKVAILDEIDASNPNTLLALNGLKQDYMQFPDALIKVHKEFRLIGTANTLVYDELYNARQPMDLATIARFKVIKYDMEIHDLALRYGLDYIKSIDVSDKTPREVAREVREIIIKENK